MTQEQIITEHLLAGMPITAMTALKLYGCFRLAARIHEIRQAMRVDVVLRTLPSGKRIAEYRLKPKTMKRAAHL